MGEEKKKGHAHTYHKDDLEIARAFTKEAYKEFGAFLKAIVLFGSQAKKAKDPHEKTHQKSDIDILVIVDNLTMTITPEIQQTYKLVMENIVGKVSKRIHLTTLTFINFWELFRNSDPVVLNMLRDGVPLKDSGFFDPLQALLYQGRIRPSWESIWTYYTRGSNTLYNAQHHLMQATIDLYWACADIAHAALMRIGELPPSPSHIADMLDAKLHKTGKLHKRYVTIMHNLQDVSKHIMRREIKEITGRDFDRYNREAHDFMDAMKRIIEQ